MALDRKIATVNLTSGKVDGKTVPRGMREAYLGGRGMNTYLLFNRMASVADGLAPESVVVLGAGLLCGLPVPSAASMHVAYRSPLSGFLGSATFTGHFGAELRLSGFDHLVIQGKASSLSLLLVTDEEISLASCPELAGADTLETVRRAREILGDEEAQVLCIGPAGEKGVLLSDVRPSFGEGWGGAGLGAVFGAKNLKAIVVRGTGSLELHTPNEALRYHADMTRRLLSTETGRALSKWGTPFLFAGANASGMIRVNHFGMNQLARSDSIEGEALASFSPAGSSCFSCPIACRRLFRWDGRGGGMGEGPGFESLSAFGPLMGCRSPTALLDADLRCRREGLHPWETGATIAWAAEAFGRKVLKPTQIDESPPVFEDPEAFLPWIDRIANREGFGEVLGRGIRRAGEQLGPEVLKLAVHVKGMAMPPHDVRAAPALALASATASAGPESWNSAPFLDLLALPEEVLTETFGGPDAFEGPFRSSFACTEGKARMVLWQEACNMLADSLGICRLATAFLSPNFMRFPEFSKALYFSTGLKLTPGELLRIAERSLCLERMFNLRIGLTRKDDWPAERLFQESIPKGPPAVRGKTLDREALQGLVNEIYELRGLTPTGIPLERKKKDLGLEEEPSHKM